MKESKPAEEKIPSGSAKNNDAITVQKEIELLKKRLKRSEKKCNREQERSKYFSDIIAITEADACLLKKKLLNAQAEIKSLEARVSTYLGMLLKESEILEQATKNYCNILINKNKNLSPCSINDIEYHKAELKNIIKKLSCIADSNKHDLLKSYNIKEFMNNQN